MALFAQVSFLFPQHKTFLPNSLSTLTNPYNSTKFTLQTYSNTIPTSPKNYSIAATIKEQSDVQVQSATSVSGWAAFAKNVSGEWDGFGAEFTEGGNPIELPESVVPEAYREWEVKVYDWQTQCPSLAEEDAFSFMYKSIRLLPTVGCEADAATRHSIDERNVDVTSAFAFQPTGCYVAIWPDEKVNERELEHCLVDPRDKESRVRVIQVVRFQDSKLVLRRVKVFCEHWYGPFRNGDQLGGCAIQDSAFAATKALDPAQVIGVWEGKHAISSFHNAPQKAIQELVDSDTRKTTRDGLDLVLLPKQLWCSLKDIGGGQTCCEVGWLLEKGRTITSKCLFSDSSKLKEIAIASESAASTQ